MSYTFRGLMNNFKDPGICFSVTTAFENSKSSNCKIYMKLSFSWKSQLKWNLYLFPVFRIYFFASKSSCSSLRNAFDESN